jgi:ankyrin repeat protein
MRQTVISFSQIEMQHSAEPLNFLRSKITPLMNASYSGHLEVVKNLIKAGANLSKTNMYVLKTFTYC